MSGSGTARSSRVSSGPPVLAALLLCTLMLPIIFKVGSLNLTVSRLLLTVLLPFLLLRVVSGAYGRFLPVDAFVILFMAWRTIAAFVRAPNVALEYSASNAAIFLGAYLVARASIRTVEDFRFVARMLGMFVLLSLPFAIYEARTSHMVIPRLLEKIPGIATSADVNYGARKGIFRVQFVFTHPIHYGLFCSTAFGLVFIALKGSIGLVRRKIWGGIIVFCCFLSVSSGPFLALLSQVGLVGYDWVFRRNPRRWPLLFWTGGIIYLILEVLSDRPAFYAISSRLAFNSSTANVRMVLLDYGLAQIPRTPVFGIGFSNNWGLPSWMTGSLDNFWLAMPLQFGIPAGLFLLLSFSWPMIKIGRRSFREGGALANARFGWMIVMFSLMLTLATVYIWAEIASLVFFMLGAGVFLLDASESDGGLLAAAADNTQSRQGTRHTRFGHTPSRRRDSVAVLNSSSRLVHAKGRSAPETSAQWVPDEVPPHATTFSRKHAADARLEEKTATRNQQDRLPRRPSFSRRRDA